MDSSGATDPANDQGPTLRRILRSDWAKVLALVCLWIAVVLGAAYVVPILTAESARVTVSQRYSILPLPPGSEQLGDLRAGSNACDRGACGCPRAWIGGVYGNDQPVAAVVEYYRSFDAQGGPWSVYSHDPDDTRLWGLGEQGYALTVEVLARDAPTSEGLVADMFVNEVQSGLQEYATVWAVILKYEPEPCICCSGG